MQIKIWKAKVLRLGQISEYLINVILKVSIIYLQSTLFQIHTMQLENSICIKRKGNADPATGLKSYDD